MPFCKMCFDLGRADFDKHYVRDPAGNTTCPYILNTKCKNCGYCGHTSTYCKMPRRVNHSIEKPVKYVDNPVVKHVAKPKNAFELLCVDADDEDQVDEDELPDLSKIQWGKGLTKKSWADAVEEEENKPRTWAQVVVR